MTAYKIILANGVEFTVLSPFCKDEVIASCFDRTGVKVKSCTT